MDGLVDFDQQGFESGILLAMGLGIPDDPDLQPTFLMPDVVELPDSASVDPEGVPFNPFVRPLRTPVEPIRVLCAVEFLDRAGNVLDFAVAQADQARLTLLDAQYRQVEGFEAVLLGGTNYRYSQTYPPLALGPSVIWQVMVTTEDQG